MNLEGEDGIHALVSSSEFVQRFWLMPTGWPSTIKRRTELLAPTRKDSFGIISSHPRPQLWRDTDAPNPAISKPMWGHRPTYESVELARTIIFCIHLRVCRCLICRLFPNRRSLQVPLVPHLYFPSFPLPHIPCALAYAPLGAQSGALWAASPRIFASRSGSPFSGSFWTGPFRDAQGLLPSQGFDWLTSILRVIIHHGGLLGICIIPESC